MSPAAPVVAALLAGLLAGCAAREVAVVSGARGEVAEVSDTSPLLGEAASLASVDGVDASRGLFGAYAAQVPAGYRRLGVNVVVAGLVSLRIVSRELAADLLPGVQYELRAFPSEHEPPASVNLVRLPDERVVATSEPGAQDLTCAQGHLDDREWKVSSWITVPGEASVTWVPAAEDPVAPTLEVSAWAGLPPLGATDEDAILDIVHQKLKGVFEDVHWAILAREEGTRRSLVAAWSGARSGRLHEGLEVARNEDGRGYRLSVECVGRALTEAERHEWQQRLLAARVFPPLGR